METEFTMRTNVTRPNFSDYDFISLYCAMIYEKGLLPIINHYELEKELYKYYYREEYKELFKDIIPLKDQMMPERNHLDLKVALNTAQAFGRIEQIKYTRELKSIVYHTPESSQKMTSRYDPEIVDKMSKLLDEMYQLDKKQETKKTSIKKKTR